MAGLAAGGFRELEAAPKDAAATAPDPTPLPPFALAYFGFAPSPPAPSDLLFDAGLLSDP